VPLVEQDLFTLSEHMSSPLSLVGSHHSIFSFMCILCRSLFVLLSFFFWPLCCLSSIYGFLLPFSIFKLLFQLQIYQINHVSTKRWTTDRMITTRTNSPPEEVSMITTRTNSPPEEVSMITTRTNSPPEEVSTRW
jgi:hypothetical protein